VLVHSHDSVGLWGPVTTLTLNLDRTPPTMLSGIAEPDPSNGTTGSSADPTAIKVNAAFTDPVSANLSSPIMAAEGFLDNPNGAAGTGLTFVASGGNFDTASEAAYGLIPLPQLTGTAKGQHEIYVHAKDLAGNWGTLAPLSLVVDRRAPVANATARPRWSGTRPR
jgi:hypothetical protein